MAATGRSSEDVEPLPPLTESTTATTPSPLARIETFIPRSVRSGTMKLLDADIARGMSGLTATTWAQSPTLSEVRQGLYTTGGNERARQFETADTPMSFKQQRTSQAPNGLRTSTTVQPPPEQQTYRTSADVASNEKLGRVTGMTAEKVALDKLETATSTKLDLTHTPTFQDSDLHLTESGTYPNGYR